MEEVHQLSQAFKEQIIYQGPQYCIPPEFVLKALDLPSFSQIPSLGHLPSVQPRLDALPAHLDDHALLPLLNRLDLDLLPATAALLNAFTTALPLLPHRPFYLAADKTYMQELSPGTEVVVDEEREGCLRWQRKTAGGREWVSVGLLEELVTVGSGEEGKEWRGMKFYAREGFAAVEMGLWRAGTPFLNLMAKYPHDHAPLELYLRQFDGRKVKHGELRYIDHGSLCIYQEKGGFEPHP